MTSFVLKDGSKHAYSCHTGVTCKLKVKTFQGKRKQPRGRPFIHCPPPRRVMSLRHCHTVSAETDCFRWRQSSYNSTRLEKCAAQTKQLCCWNNVRASVGCPGAFPNMLQSVILRSISIALLVSVTVTLQDSSRTGHPSKNLSFHIVNSNKLK